MPEALAIIPPKCVQTGNSSETDTASTARSSDDASTTVVAPIIVAINQRKRLQQTQEGQNKKSRKSVSRRTQKKPLKINSTQKTAAAHNLKITQIPRPFPVLTPSSSTTSLTSSSGSSSNITFNKQLAIPPKTQLIRQKSTIQLDYRLRKSISQMDIKQARRMGNFQLPLNPNGRGGYLRERGGQENQPHGNSISNITIRSNPCPSSENSKDIITKNEKQLALSSSSSTLPGGLLVTKSQTDLMHKMFHPNDYYYVLQEHDPKMTGMKIFATIMLNAWRKRRDEVKRLGDELTDLKRGSIKSKNQLHVFNTLFRVEQKRNEDISCQLKRSMEDVNQTKASCESLTTSVISLKADKSLLAQEVMMKEQEIEALNTLLTQTKSDLFKAMAQQRELQANLSMEQRKVQLLENQKNELINEICELNNDALQKEETLHEQLQMKESELSKVRNELKLMDDLVADMKTRELRLQDYATNEAKLKSEVEVLHTEVCRLKKSLAQTLGYRMRTFWVYTVNYQRVTFQMLHWLAHYLLPATPQPKMSTVPYGLSLEKALSIVKH